MKRCTLHRSKLDEFTLWCAEHGYETRPGKSDMKSSLGGYEVLQVRYRGRWHRIWDRLRGDHYTVESHLITLITLIHKYISTRNTGKRKNTPRPAE